MIEISKSSHGCFFLFIHLLLIYKYFQQHFNIFTKTNKYNTRKLLHTSLRGRYTGICKYQKQAHLD